MSSDREALMRALRAVDASLSVLVVARETILDQIKGTPETPAAPFSGEGAAGPCKATGGQHPAEALEDVGVASGALVCSACGEQV